MIFNAPPEQWMNLKEWVIIITGIIGLVVLLRGYIAKGIRWGWDKVFGKRSNAIMGELKAMRDDLKNLSTEVDRGNRSNKVILRDRIRHICECYIKQGYVSTRQLEALTGLYEMYVELGGNSFIHGLYRAVCALPIRENLIETEVEKEMRMDE